MTIDASERIIGQPISPQELERIRAQGVKKTEILYEEVNSPLRPIQTGYIHTE